ncbi:MAG: YHS domain-containing (seleno)protein [Planktomarina sp.]
MFTRRTLLTMAAATPVVLAGAPAFAGSPQIYSADGTVAINGYDPVAYFTQEDAIAGTAEFSSDWQGATFLFESAENKAAFDASPDKFAPQYGGYCAWAVSKGYTASTDPYAWTVFEGKLYLNYSKSVRARWAIGRRGNIAAADANWPSVLG